MNKKHKFRDRININWKDSVVLRDLTIVFICTIVFLCAGIIEKNIIGNDKFENSKESSIVDSGNILLSKSKKQSIETSQSKVISTRVDKSDKYIDSILNIPSITNSNLKAQEEFNKKVKDDIDKFFENNYREAKKNFLDNEAQGIKYVANTDFEVKKNTENMLSIIVKYYSYSGGAHGIYEDVSYNMDIKRGKFINLSDLFVEGSNYKEIINNQIKNQIEESEKANKENIGIYQFSSIDDNQKFYFADEVITIYFDLYKIAPYAAGIPEFRLDKNSLIPIVKEEYIKLFSK